MEPIEKIVRSRKVELTQRKYISLVLLFCFVTFLPISGYALKDAPAAWLRELCGAGMQAPQLESLEVVPNTATLDIGQSFTFEARGTFSDGSIQELTDQVSWTSSNESVGTISSSGRFTAASAGDTTVRAAREGESDTASVTVRAEAQTPVVVQSGNGDIVVGFDPAEGAWEFLVLAEGVDPGGMPVKGEFDSETVYIAVPPATQEVRPYNVPNTLDFDPIGIEAEAIFWKLPQTETEAEADGAMFLGIASVEVPSGVFQNDAVLWTLTRVVPPLGTGDFSLYQDTVPGPTFFMSSADATANSGLLQSVRGVDHFNYGFTTPGLWQVELTVDATLLDGTPSSATGRYFFQVGPALANSRK